MNNNWESLVKKSISNNKQVDFYKYINVSFISNSLPEIEQFECLNVDNLGISFPIDARTS